MHFPSVCGELSGRVEKLLKCLKQAGREWQLLLVKWLAEVGAILGGAGHFPHIN